MTDGLNRADQLEGVARILIPGWAMSGGLFQGVWGTVLPSVSQESINALERRIQCLERLHITGVSLGGYVAIQMAQKYPDRVLGLTLLGMRPVYSLKTIEGIERSMRRDAQGFLAAFYKSCFKTQTALQRFLELNQRVDGDLKFGLDLLKSARLSDVDGLAIPIEWIHGIYDQVAPYDEILAFLQARGMQITALDAGHLDGIFL